MFFTWHAKLIVLFKNLPLKTSLRKTCYATENLLTGTTNE